MWANSFIAVTVLAIVMLALRESSVYPVLFMPKTALASVAPSCRQLSSPADTASPRLFFPKVDMMPLLVDHSVSDLLPQQTSKSLQMLDGATSMVSACY